MSRSVPEEGSWSPRAGARRLHYRLWRPPAVCAVLAVVHGFGEHGGRYDPVARELAERGICVAVPDLPGHGTSEGAPGDLGSLSECVADLRALVRDAVLPRCGRTEYAVFGHSFGGLMAILWALERPADLCRLAVQSPLLEVGFRIPRWKTAAAQLLGRAAPQVPLSMGIDPDWLSGDPDVVRAYRADPLVHGRMSARTYQALLRARTLAQAQARLVRAPVLLLLGEADRIISLRAARSWFERLQAPRALRVFAEARHELHHEPVREEVIRLLADWTLGRMTPEQGSDAT